MKLTNRDFNVVRQHLATDEGQHKKHILLRVYLYEVEKKVVVMVKLNVEVTQIDCKSYLKSWHLNNMHSEVVSNQLQKRPIF